MQVDISQFLAEWPYDPKNWWRIIKTELGQEALQIRRPCGIDQYLLDGRADGKLPFGRESALAEYEARLQEELKKQEGAPGFSLSHEDFLILYEEGLLYYQRYLLLFKIGDLARTIRDTEHNLRICELVEAYAEQEEDKNRLLQYRPYIIKVNALAKARLELRQGLVPVAKELLASAIAEIKNLPEIKTIIFQVEKTRALHYLAQMLSQIEEKGEFSELEKLKIELESALQREDYV